MRTRARGTSTGRAAYLLCASKLRQAGNIRFEADQTGTFASPPGFWGAWRHTCSARDGRDPSLPHACARRRNL